MCVREMGGKLNMEGKGSEGRWVWIPGVDHPQQQKRRVQAREGGKGDLQQKDSSEIEREDLQEGSEACYDASLGSIKKKSVRAEGAEIFSGSERSGRD